MSRKILNFATFGLAGVAAKALFGKKKKKEEAPTTPEPAVMPLPDDERIGIARRRSIIRQRARRGRDSTILTTPGSALGGGY